MKKYKIIISGGGTGGHLFPALSVANEIKHRFPDADILFIGAEDRMEMERVPAAGFQVIGLPVSGFNRKNPLKNFRVIARLVKSLRLARKIIRDFKPDIAIGVGGYASGPTLWMASSLHVPVLIQEQNSYAGMTNKILGKRASKICVAYPGMDAYFPEDRIVVTGNPVRKELETIRVKNEEAFHYFGLKTDKPVLLVLGGSLGARTINRSVQKGLATLLETGIQVIWQTGRTYSGPTFSDENLSSLYISDFISRMDYAYSIADLVVSRAGAGTISELCLLQKPAILVPSPNVAEDHQTKNALALSDVQAAIFISDEKAEQQLTQVALASIGNSTLLHELSVRIAGFAQHNSAERIVDEVIQLIDNK